jgi:hypothetical protein
MSRQGILPWDMSAERSWRVLAVPRSDPCDHVLPSYRALRPVISIALGGLVVQVLKTQGPENLAMIGGYIANLNTESVRAPRSGVENLRAAEVVSRVLETECVKCPQAGLETCCG